MSFAFSAERKRKKAQRLLAGGGKGYALERWKTGLAKPAADQIRRKKTSVFFFEKKNAATTGFEGGTKKEIHDLGRGHGRQRNSFMSWPEGKKESPLSRDQHRVGGEDQGSAAIKKEVWPFKEETSEGGTNVSAKKG